MSFVRFSQWLGDLLESEGWDQTTAAETFQTSQSQISSWLSGRTIPSLSSLERIAEALNRTPEEVLAKIYGRVWDGSAPLTVDLAIAQIQNLDPQEQIVICARLLSTAVDATLISPAPRVKKPKKNQVQQDLAD